MTSESRDHGATPEPGRDSMPPTEVVGPVIIKPGGSAAFTLRQPGSPPSFRAGLEPSGAFRSPSWITGLRWTGGPFLAPQGVNPLVRLADRPPTLAPTWGKPHL